MSVGAKLITLEHYFTMNVSHISFDLAYGNPACLMTTWKMYKCKQTHVFTKNSTPDTITIQGIYIKTYMYS